MSVSALQSVPAISAVMTGRALLKRSTVARVRDGLELIPMMQATALHKARSASAALGLLKLLEMPAHTPPGAAPNVHSVPAAIALAKNSAGIYLVYINTFTTSWGLAQ